VRAIDRLLDRNGISAGAKKSAAKRAEKKKRS
jgi:hypothetical protein